jgi:O-antigen ligase
MELGIDKSFKMFYLFSAIVIATSLEEDFIEHIITAFLSGMFISEIIAYGVFFELWTFKNATVVTPSPFMMHIDYSVYLAITSILLLNRLFSSSYSFREKLIIGFFFLTVTGNLFLSTGRTGQVGLIAGIVVMSFYHYKISFKSIIVSILLLVTIYSSAYKLSNSFRMRVSNAISDIKGIQKMDFSSSIGIRVAFYITTYGAIQKNPLGYGIGDYKDATKDELATGNYPSIQGRAFNFMQHMHPHNLYLQVLLQTGFIGLIMLFFVIYYLLRLKTNNKDMKSLAILFTVVFFTSSMAEPLILSRHFVIGLFVIFVGLFGTLEKVNKYYQ